MIAASIFCAVVNIKVIKTFLLRRLSARAPPQLCSKTQSVVYVASFRNLCSPDCSFHSNPTSLQSVCTSLKLFYFLF